MVLSSIRWVVLSEVEITIKIGSELYIYLYIHTRSVGSSRNFQYLLYVSMMVGTIIGNEYDRKWGRWPT
jgi:hypothetical protein